MCASEYEVSLSSIVALDALDEDIRFVRFAYLGANDTFQSSSGTAASAQKFCFCENPNNSAKESVDSPLTLSIVARRIASAADTTPGARLLSPSFESSFKSTVTKPRRTAATANSVVSLALQHKSTKPSPLRRASSIGSLKIIVALSFLNWSETVRFVDEVLIFIALSLAILRFTDDRKNSAKPSFAVAEEKLFIFEFMLRSLNRNVNARLERFCRSICASTSNGSLESISVHASASSGTSLYLFAYLPFSSKATKRALAARRAAAFFATK